VVIDGLSPTRTERPANAEDLARLLAEADAAGHAVVPVGGGRALGLGEPLRRWDVALSSAGLDRVIEASGADMTLTVEAGATLEQVDEALRPLGQHLPVDPQGGPGHTIGGVLASGLYGPLRQRYGGPRDFLIGLRVALPDGRLVASGGRVVKNVSGYDLQKLHLGALGSLGVIVAASFKVFPRPHQELELLTTAPDPWAEVDRALTLAERPQALEIDSGGSVRARLGGSGGSVARLSRELGWEEVEPAGWAGATEGEPVLARIAVPARHLRTLLSGLPEGSRWWAWPGIGIAHWSGAPGAAVVAEVREAAEAAGGSLVLIEAPTELRAAVGAFGSAPPTLEWMRKLRDAFDPRRTISPGRFLV
jgi:glycolate oxidase FAD binding subunit